MISVAKCNRSVPLLNKEGLGEVLLEKLFSTPVFQKGEVNGYCKVAYIIATKSRSDKIKPA